jgi:hypothetical protein
MHSSQRLGSNKALESFNAEGELAKRKRSRDFCGADSPIRARDIGADRY